MLFSSLIKDTVILNVNVQSSKSLIKNSEKYEMRTSFPSQNKSYKITILYVTRWQISIALMLDIKALSAVKASRTVYAYLQMSRNSRHTTINSFDTVLYRFQTTIKPKSISLTYNQTFDSDKSQLFFHRATPFLS